MTIPGAWARAARGAMLLSDDGELKGTIFGEMSALAEATGAINLGQGFPDEDGPDEVLEAARQAISDGLNQYPPGRGMPVLRQAIADHQKRFYGITVDPDREVLVTVGATEALAATIIALTDEGDEVVTFEPFYDSYAGIAGLNKATHRTVGLRAPDFQPDLDELRSVVNDKTRLILINNPHNPTGTVFTREVLEAVVELAQQHDAIIVTDEVYEHVTFGVPHISMASIPGAAERTVTISSGGKTFNTTGWKIGWLTAPAELIDAIISVKQFLTFENGAPFQPAIALGLGLPDSYFEQHAAKNQQKRDLLHAGLTAAGLTVSNPQGGYFLIADAASIGYDDAATLCRKLPELAGVVGVPISAFVRPENRAGYNSLVRFAFCKKIELLERASAQLADLRR